MKTRFLLLGLALCAAAAIAADSRPGLISFRRIAIPDREQALPHPANRPVARGEQRGGRPGGSTTAASVLGVADAALYLAKASGRNGWMQIEVPAACAAPHEAAAHFRDDPRGALERGEVVATRAPQSTVHSRVRKAPFRSLQKKERSHDADQ